MKRKLIHVVLPVLAVVMLFCVRTHKISAATIVQSGRGGGGGGGQMMAAILHGHLMMKVV